MVYVLNKEGKPLMPTNRHGKVRHLLNDGRAIVVRKCPFTIKLLYDATEYTQDVVLNMDAGSKVIGASAKTDKRELYSAEVELRNDIVKLLSVRREARRTRRNRKTRYRKPRFNNRVSAKKEGWLAPSIRNKINSHLKEAAFVQSILPVTKIVVETASFDIQKIKNHDISGKEYQEGNQLGFWNVREYVLFRDGHICQCCKGKSKDKILNVHHIESRKTGGDAPNNLITLCETCHTKYHKGLTVLPENIKRGMSFRDAAFMGIMRWAFFNKLKESNPDIKVLNSYGYITKNKHIKAGLPKYHRIDALCVSGNTDVTPCDTYYYKKNIRKHNRQIHKFNILKGGIRKRNQFPFEVKGFRLFDKVDYNGTTCFISGRRATGYFKLITLNGTVIHNSAKAKNLRLIEKGKTTLIEQRQNNYGKEDERHELGSYVNPYIRSSSHD